MVSSWDTFPGDEARRHRNHFRTPSGRLTGRERSNKISERHGRWGREMEQRVAAILEKMVQEGLLHSAIYHEPNSSEDQAGKDFTVEKMVGGELVIRSFAITIRPPKMWDLLLHTDVLQWYLPINTKDLTIRRKVLGLF